MVVTLAAMALFASPVSAWIDYGTSVERDTPAFGKAYRGVALKLETEKAEFELGTPEPVSLVLRNRDRIKLAAPETLTTSKGARKTALYIVLATESGASYFTPDLGGRAHGKLSAGILPQTVNSNLLTVPFDDLRFRRVETFRNGWPHVKKAHPVRASTDLTPQLYSMRAILLSGQQGKRPDFTVASNVWPVLLRPQQAASLSEKEKQRKLEGYLRDLKRGAYGGKRVASQLAALGETAVDPLIAVADQKGGKTTMESRVWALVALCNNPDPRSDAYVRKRLHEPTALGDLRFLAWHSQACRDPSVQKSLHRLVKKAACGPGTPWDKHFNEVPDHVVSGFLEFAFKQYTRTQSKVDDRIVSCCLARSTPKPAAYALAVWQPSGPDAVLRTLTPSWLKWGQAPNLKSAILRSLDKWCRPVTADMPAYRRGDSVERQWFETGLWLAESGRFTTPQKRVFLTVEVLTVRDPALKTRVREAVRRTDWDTAPPKIDTARTGAWTTLWRWALNRDVLTEEQAVLFLVSRMRREETLQPSDKRAILEELKVRLPAIPFDNGARDINAAWAECGKWLVKQGYFD